MLRLGIVETLPKSVCTGDGINDLRRLKPGCFAGLWAAARSHTDFCRMSSEMSPIWLVFGTKVVQNAFCPQIDPFRGHFAEMLTLKLRLRSVTWPLTFRVYLISLVAKLIFLSVKIG